MLRAILMDCDGVLTDGTYWYTEDGKSMKRFSCIDSKGIGRAAKAGVYLAVISEDPTGYRINRARCEDLGIDYFRAASPADKLTIAERLLSERGATLADCAYLADDVGDKVLLEQVGHPVAVANAVDEIKNLVETRGGYVTQRNGGLGAVREAIEWLLENT